MNELSVELILELRQLAEQNESVPVMLRMLMQRLGPEGAYPTTLMRYFREAFYLDLQPLIIIGSWHPLTSVCGAISDVALHEAISPHIKKARERWIMTLAGKS